MKPTGQYSFPYSAFDGPQNHSVRYLTRADDRLDCQIHHGSFVEPNPNPITRRLLDFQHQFTFEAFYRDGER